MKIKSSEGKTQYVIIVDHDRINNVPMIANRKSEQHEDQKLRRENSTLKQFVIIVDHDRINNVPMIKSQEG
jgi:predicted Fe-Mo cluster-binding NifX family protein